MGHLIVVVPATGGVGATTLAAALAVRAAETGRPVVAVDLDPVAGRLDAALGLEQEPGWRWPDLAGARGVVDGDRLSVELPGAGPLRVLSGPVVGGPAVAGPVVGRPAPGRVASAVDGWLAALPGVVAGLTQAHEVTVLDAARDERVLAAVAGLVDAAVLIVGTSVPALAGAAGSVPALRSVLDSADRVPEPWLVLRGARPDEHLEQLVADHLEAPVLGVVVDDARVASDAAAGVAPGSRGRGSLVRAADDVLLALAGHPVRDRAA